VNLGPIDSPFKPLKPETASGRRVLKYNGVVLCFTVLLAMKGGSSCLQIAPKNLEWLLLSAQL